MSLSETIVITTQMAIAASGTLKGGVLTLLTPRAVTGAMSSGVTGTTPVVGNTLILMIVTDDRGRGVEDEKMG